MVSDDLMGADSNNQWHIIIVLAGIVLYNRWRGDVIEFEQAENNLSCHVHLIHDVLIGLSRVHAIMPMIPMPWSILLSCAQ